MKKCKICQREINDNKTVCNECSYKKRNFKYYANEVNEIIDFLFNPQYKEEEEEKRIVIAS